MTRTKPYLSIVSVSRNDDHGGHLLDRMQLFIDSLSDQCNQYQIQTELIIVEWNPPENKERLHEVLHWPGKTEYFRVRIIVVPNKLHTTFENSDRIPLFQMIGKNVGIRRALGEFILVTNIDILFSPELMKYISKKNLQKDIIYRVDRIDVSSPFSGFLKFFGKQSLAVMRIYCKSNVIRVNNKFGSFPAGFLNMKFKAYLQFMVNKIRYQSTGKIPFYGDIHTNGCGDFTLMSQELWMKLGGYPELPIFSWNIDSLLLILAYHSSIKEIDLKPPKNIFHIEHGPGSGWTPGEGEKLLFKRLEENEIPFFTWKDCVDLSKTLNESRKIGINIDFNNFNKLDWGLKSIDLNEIIIN